MADTKLDDLASGAPAAGTDIIYAVKDPAGTPVDRKLSLENVKDYILGLANTWTAPQTINGGTVTTSSPVLDLAQTWNASGTTFTGLRLNVTNTASAPGSKLFDVQLGGASVFEILASSPLSAIYVRVKAGGQNQVGLGSLNSNIPPIVVQSTGSYGWSASSDAFSGSYDLILTRRGAANLRLGAADAASPVAQTLSVQSVSAGTSNTAGANLTITGSQGTGTGAGGSIIFQVAPAGTTGTAQNALSTALTITTNDVVVNIATNRFFIVSDKTGETAGVNIQGSTGSISTLSGAAIQWTNSATNSFSTPDVILRRDAANTLALRNGTNAQELRWYRTFTDASNRQNGALTTSASEIIIEAQTAGTGADDIDVTLTPAGTGNVRFGTHTATSDTAVSGYIEIKDAGGTIRKLAVIT